MKQTSILAVLAFLVMSASATASPLDAIEKVAPLYFGQVFEQELYKLSNVNAYDHDLDNLGQPLVETPVQKIERVKRRKINKVNDTLMKQLDDYQLFISGQNKLVTKRTVIKAIGCGTLLGGFYFGPAGYLWAKSLIAGSAAATTSATASSTATTVTAGVATAMGAAANALKKVGSPPPAAAPETGGFASKAVVALGALGFSVNSAIDAGIDQYFNLGEEGIKIALLKKTLLEKLETEAVIPVEELYLTHQHELAADQREAIEKAILKARRTKPMDGAPILAEWVQEIIDFPRKVIPLPYGVHFENPDLHREARERFLNDTFPTLCEPARPPRATDGRPHLDAHYGKNTRLELRSFLSQIIDDSVSPFPLFKGAIFYGEPGTGKTKAAELAAETAGLPFFRLEITGREDIKPENLIGRTKEAWQNGVTKGKLVEAFFTRNKDGKRGLNPVILLDDIDRGFGEGGNSVNMEGLMGRLLKLYDRAIEFMEAVYYEFQFDFIHPIIIATMNRDIRKDAQFKALKSRCGFVDFGEADPEAKNQLTKTNIIEFITDTMFKRSNAYHSKPAEWDSIRTAVANFIVDNFDSDDFRECQYRAAELVKFENSKWQDLAIRREWKRK